MLTTSDFVDLAYSPDLTQAGIAYACRSLTRTYFPQGGSQYGRLQQIVAEVAVELAFRRHLVTHKVPHNTLGIRPFTDPDRYDMYLGGRKCAINCHLITRREIIRRLRNDPDYLLQASAQVHKDQLESDNQSDRDLYVFAFVTALVTPTRDELKRALNANQPSYCVHLLPENWASPTPWESLGQLVIKADISESITLELGGQGETHEFLNARIQLPPNRQICSQANFYSLAYLHTTQIPDAQVGIYSPIMNQTHNITSHEWGNIWVYGMDITLAGFMTRGEFRRKARPEPTGRQVFKPPPSRSSYMVLPISELRSLNDLFKSAKDWYRGI